MLSGRRHGVRQVARLALLPLWLAQLATGMKAFSGNPVLGSRKLNELGLHNLRQDLAHALAERRRRRLGSRIADAHRAAFERDGFVLVSSFLSPSAFATLEQQVRAYRGSAREMVQGDTITRRIALDGPARRAIPAIHTLLRNAVWRALIRYVGSHDHEPVCYIQTILAGAVAGPPDPQTVLHADTFQPTVKAWLTLTDVAEDGGPFVYVPGSHRLTTPRRRWERRMSIEASNAADRLTGRGSFRLHPEDIAALGYQPPRIFAVPANTLIVADTSGFHARGPSATPGLRVEIWAYGRRNPFLSLPVDPWRIAPIGAARAPMFWWIGDRLERLGLKRQVWRPRVHVSAFDVA